MNWPYYVARDEGRFAAAGLDVAETVYSNTGGATTALLAGDLDIAHIIPDRALPAPLRAVARVLDRPSYRLFGRPSVSGSSLRAGVATDSPVRVDAAAAPLRVGVSALDSGDGLLIRPLLRSLGIHGDLVLVGGPEARVAALLDGRMDAIMVTEPFAFTLEDAGMPLLGDLRQALPDFPFALCVVRGDGPPALATYLGILRQARERLKDPASSAILAGTTGCTVEVAERVRRFYLRDGHLGRFDP